MKTKTTLKWLLLPLLVLVCAICSLFIGKGIEVKAAETTEITFTESTTASTAQDVYGNGNPAKRYLLYVKSDKTLPDSPTPHGTFTVKKNGEDTGKTISLAMWAGGDNYFFTCDYATLTGDDSVTTAAQIKDVYLITMAAGSTIGGFTTTSDVTFRLSGYDVFNMAGISEFELTHKSTGPQDNLTRYLITLNTPAPLSGTCDVNVSVSKNGGAEEIKTFTLWKENNTMAYLLVNYATLTGDSECEKSTAIFDTYKLSFKAGTLFGGKYSMKSTLTYLISEERCVYMPEMAEEDLTDNQFVVNTTGINDTQEFARYEISASCTADVGAHTLVAATLDGKAFSVDIYRNGGTSVTLLIPYAKIQAGAKSAGEVGEHEIIIAKGTQFGSHKMTSGFVFRLNGAEIEVIDPERLISRPITLAATENGTVVADKETALVDERITLTITPAERYEVAAITVNGEEQTLAGFDGTTYVFAMPMKEVEVNVTFKLVVVSISLPVGVTVTSEQTGEMHLGDNYTFTVAPSIGFALQEGAKVLFNGTEITANDGVYTVTFDKKANVISIQGCVPNKYTVTFKDGDSVLKTEEVQFNGKISKYEPTKEGYAFVGWFIGEEEFSVNTVITEDTVLAARFVQTEAPVEDNGKKGGCSSNIMGGAYVFALMALASVALVKGVATRKED